MTWEAVYAASYRRLVALIAAVCGSVSEAEEAVQEAFVRALGLTGQRPVVNEPEAWLYRVAVNIVRGRWRRMQVAKRLEPLVATDPVISPQPDARLALLEALRLLPFPQREALVLHYFGDLSIEEIAARVGAPIGTVKARLSRGRDALGKRMEEVPTP